MLHLKKEVSRCINFWSADEDVDLVDINTFYADAPKDVSKSEITRGRLGTSQCLYFPFN